MRIVVLALLLLGGACSTTSTIRYRDGLEEEVNVVDGDERKIVVRGAGREGAIARAEIADIDYPGNVSGTIGLWIVADSVVAGAIALERCEGDWICAAPGWGWLPLGVGLAWEGFSRWSAAKERAGARFEGRRPRPQLPELALRADEFVEPPRLDLAELPLACHALIQSDRTSLVSHATAASTEPECALTRGETRRAPFQNEILRVERFDGRPDSARLVVRDLTGASWTSPCVCLAPK